MRHLGRVEAARVVDVQLRKDAHDLVDRVYGALHYVDDTPWHERSPAWWPRDPKPIVRKRPPPDPNMQAAAAARLKEIRAKLEAGEGLTAQEEEDATAILELKMIWAEQAKAAEEERQAARARPSAASADTPASMAKIMKAEARGQEVASLLTWS